MTSSSICHFCAHGNPAGSRFCNQCGSPLDLKPCGQCDAMNHVSVDRCYQCGTAFAAEDGVLEVAEVGAGTAAAESTAAARAVSPPPLYSTPPLYDDTPPPGPADRIPVALSDRIDASTERVAIPGQPTHPLTPFADASHSDDVDDDGDWVDPRRLHAARKGLRAERRRHRVAQAALAGVCVFVIGAAAYYVLDTGMVPRVFQMARALGAADDQPRSAPPATTSAQPTTRTSAAAAPEKATANEGAVPTADTGAASASSASPAVPSTTSTTSSAPLPEPAPSPPAPASSVSPPASAPSVSSPASALSVPLAASPPSVPAAARSHAATAPSSLPRAVANAPATERSAASEPARRAPGEPARKSRAAPPPSVDKDALATQRLIERDLAGFLPPEPPRRTLR